jgi:16S rRNA (guanine966-N2)-methyltransferase
MYIGGGDFKGRKIPSKYLPVRPTTGKAKQALFNILQNYMDWSQCDALDLCCGTGSLTYELASRGCKQVTAVDISGGSCNFVRKNLTAFGIDNAMVIKSDLLAFLKNCNQPFDVIICDPPYDYPHYPEIADLVFTRNLLKDNGMLIVEHSKRTSFSDNPHLLQQRTYGEVNFSFFGLPHP